MERFGPYDNNPHFAELYDHNPIYASRVADIAFYVGAAGESKGKTLELACGTGRVLIATAAAGHEIVGLDASAHMLARCREKLAQQPPEVQRRARLVQSSMTNFDLGETFALITIPFRGFQHLLRVEEQLACLCCVRQHLAAGGRFIADVFNPDLRRLYDPAFLQETEEFRDLSLPDGRRFRRAWRIVAYRRAEQINELEFIYYVTHTDGQQERIVEPFPFRYFFRYEIEHLLARAGFRVAALYGDFDRSPLRDNSPEMIFVAEKSS